MRRLALAITAALAAGLLLATVAGATSVLDRDDVPTAFDMAKAGGTYNRVTDQVVTAVDFFDPLTHPAAMKGRPPSSVCVEIWTRSTPGESKPDYEACATPTRQGKGWAGSIARKRAIGPQLRIGAVKVQQPSPTRLVLRVDPDDIKRPASYRWRVEADDFTADCNAAAGCPDYAPDRPATAETRLGKPRG